MVAVCSCLNKCECGVFAECTARPIFLEPNETNGHQKTTGLRPHDTINFPFADDDRGISPSQMNFPPPPDDFLNSPKKLQPPEVLAEVRGFFDQHGTDKFLPPGIRKFCVF